MTPIALLICDGGISLWEGIMKLPRRRFLHLFAGAAALFTTAHDGFAQDWPTRPVTMVVPYVAGGATDIVARILSARLSEVLQQQVIIENIGAPRPIARTSPL